MTRFLIIPLLTVVFAATAFAQRPATDRLSERLGVSEGTAEAVASALQAVDRTPGALWEIAADLHANLTPDQRAELVAAASRERARTGERQARDRSQRGVRGEERNARPGVRDRAARGAMQGPRGVRMPGMADLTDEQRQAFRGISESFAPRLHELAEARRAGTITAEQAREQRTALRAEMRQQIESLLTPEQRQRLADIQPRAMLQQAEAARTAALNLTPEQQAQLQSVREQQRQRAAELRQQPPADRRALRQQLPQLRSEFEAAQAQVLTQEQQEIVAIHRALQKVRATRHTQRRVERQR